jgi:hypothetical protein
VPITVTVLAVTLLTTSLSLNHDEWLVHWRASLCFNVDGTINMLTTQNY